MALNNMGLGFVFTAKDLASGPMQQIDRNFRTLDGTSRNTARGLRANLGTIATGFAAATAAAGGMAAAGWALADQAAGFEQGLAAVGAVTRASAAEMDLLTSAAKQAGIATQFSPKEAVDGLTSLTTAGQTATQATESLIPALDLAAGSLGQLGVAQAAEAVVGTLNAYGMEAENAANVTDRLLRITQLTNFQTRDFEAGLSKAAAAGGTFGQSLDDTLILLGLLRNRNIDASSSSTAVREAFRRLAADQSAQAALTERGIAIFDRQTGRMRNVLDIMSDFAEASADMTEKERNAIINRAFGARGLLAYNAAQEAMFTTTRNGETVVLRGREAIEAMRVAMGEAGGTADDFRKKLADTFAGQKQLLKGVAETLIITIGTPLAKALKPVLTRVKDFVERIIKWFEALPAPVTELLGKVAVTATAIAGVLAALGAGGAGLAGVIFGLKTLAGVLSAVAGLALPVIGAIAALAAVGATLYVAWEHNIGGGRDLVVRAWSKIKLAYQALVQLFQQGGFSGAVREELSNVENQGVKRFAINVFAFVHRVRAFLRGLWDGFQAGLARLEPAFARFRLALQVLADAWGRLFGGMADDANRLPSDRYAAFGVQVSDALTAVLGVVVKLATIAARFYAGFIRGVQQVWGVARPIFETLYDVLVGLGDSVNELLVTVGLSGEGAAESGGLWETLGQIWAWISAGPLAVVGTSLTWTAGLIGGVVKAVTWLIQAVRGDLGPAMEWLSMLLLVPLTPIRLLIKFVMLIVDAFVWVSDNIGMIGRTIANFFIGIVNTVIDTIQSLLDMVRDLITAIPSELRPAALDDLAASLDISGFKVEKLRADETAQTAVAVASPEIQAAVAGDLQGTMPAAVALEARGERQSRVADALEGVERQQKVTNSLLAEGRDITVNLDGEKVGRGIDRVSNDRATRGQRVQTVR